MGLYGGIPKRTPARKIFNGVTDDVLAMPAEESQAKWLAEPIFQIPLRIRRQATDSLVEVLLLVSPATMLRSAGYYGPRPPQTCIECYPVVPMSITGEASPNGPPLPHHIRRSNRRYSGLRNPLRAHKRGGNPD
jgi:hypothetical protein